MVRIKDLKQIIKEVEEYYSFGPNEEYQSADDVPVILEMKDGMSDDSKFYDCNIIHGFTDGKHMAVALSLADKSGNPIKGVFKEFIIKEVDTKELSTRYINNFMINKHCRFISFAGLDKSDLPKQGTVKLVFEKIEED